VVPCPHYIKEFLPNTGLILGEIVMAETLTGQAPLFGGSTGGLLTKAEVEEKYAITWTSSSEQVFEMPTGGAATMRQGDNLLYLARKEQCLALAAQQLKPKKITNYKIYRVFPNGDSVLLHPNDGVFPEKVNEGRVAVNSVPRGIGANPSPGQVKFTGKKTTDP
jgi:photosystem I subunit II